LYFAIKATNSAIERSQVYIRLQDGKNREARYIYLEKKFIYNSKRGFRRRYRGKG